MVEDPTLLGLVQEVKELEVEKTSGDMKHKEDKKVVPVCEGGEVPALERAVVPKEVDASSIVRDKKRKQEEKEGKGNKHLRTDLAICTPNKKIDLIKSPKNSAQATATALASSSSNNSTPEKDQDPRKKAKGFGGRTVRVEECWICGQVRDEWQKGSACVECHAIARKKLGHQRLQTLCDSPDILEQVKSESLQKQGVQQDVTTKKSSSSDKRLDKVLSRFEAALEQLPRLEKAIVELSGLVLALKKGK